MSVRGPTAQLREESPRTADCKAVFGSLSVPIKSIMARPSLLQSGEAVWIYAVDILRISADVLRRASNWIGATFGVPPDEVEHALRCGVREIHLEAEQVVFVVDTSLPDHVSQPPPQTPPTKEYIVLCAFLLGLHSTEIAHPRDPVPTSTDAEAASWDDNPPDDCDMPESHPDGCACVRPEEVEALPSPTPAVPLAASELAETCVLAAIYRGLLKRGGADEIQRWTSCWSQVIATWPADVATTVRTWAENAPRPDVIDLPPQALRSLIDQTRATDGGR